MSFLRASLFLLVTLIASPASAIDIQEITSPGGTKVWLTEDHSIPFVALNLTFRGGASMDAEGKRGAINLMTATLEEGAGDMDSTEFATAVESQAARLGFDVDDDAVVVSASMLTKNRDASVQLLADALTKPRFAPADVDRVRAQVLSIMASEAKDPQSIAIKALAKAAWGDHPYGTSLNGTAESVAALTPDDLRAAKDRVLAQDRVLVAASGDITPEELGPLVDKLLSGLPKTASAPLPERPKMQLTEGTTVIEWKAPQTVVAFAGPGLPMSDPDYFAAYVANQILGGGGFSSRLMEEVREKRGLTYGIGTALANSVLGELWQGGFSSANEKVADALAIIRTEWDRMAKDGVTEKELADAKTYLTGSYPLRFDGNSRIAAILAGMQLIGLPADYVNTRNSKVEAVTAEDVKRVSERLLDSNDLRFILVGQPVGVK